MKPFMTEFLLDFAAADVWGRCLGQLWGNWAVGSLRWRWVSSGEWPAYPSLYSSSQVCSLNQGVFWEFFCQKMPDLIGLMAKLNGCRMTWDRFGVYKLLGQKVEQQEWLCIEFGQGFFSMIFRQFRQVNCRNSQLDEIFGWVRLKFGWVSL